MAKKKIKASDLDLSPRQVGKSCSDSSSRAVATSFEACDMSRLCNGMFYKLTC